ncbi:hypothetical protein [Litorihabitans aurantiacus]|uniref:Uncharacterized protein n=1 Tax=Litorihabitans aurantiacus TaxID=1930061 RepID=A0AA38CT21_9MICO|nr:hypothetical protein [Litorihabitans aurantiacus]GMA31437.1 hypothetical protein GCM10025875_14290 [Litorihabitans aurantiacus]
MRPARPSPVRARVVAVAIAGLTTTSVLAACSSPDDLAQEFSVEAALAQVPAATPREGLLVRAADMRAASEAAGVEHPSDGSRESWGNWSIRMSGVSQDGEEAPVVVSMPPTLNLDRAAPEDFAEVLGLSIQDADRVVDATAGASRFAVLAGDVVADLLSDDLVEVADGVRSDRDAPDLQVDLANASAVDPTGAPVRVAAQDGRIAIGSTTALLSAWLAGGDTLADDDALGPLARALDDADVVSAVLMPVTPSDDPVADAAGAGRVAPPDQVEQLRDRLDPLIPADPFLAVGVGWSAPDGEPRVHVSYAFGEDAHAQDAEGVLREAYGDGVSAVDGRPFSDRLTVEDVTVDGAVVTLELTPEPGSVGFLEQALQRRDVLFVSRA